MSDVKEQVEAAAPAAEVQTTEEPKAQDSAPAATDVVMEATAEPAADETAKNGVTEPASANAGPKTGRKYDASQLPVTDDPETIRHQVEYYLGDCNLPTDKFLWEKTGGEANNPVSLKTLCTFARMKRFQPYSAVVAALKDSEFLEVEGEDGEEVIKRKVAYVCNPDGMKKRMSKSVYIKGFGEETPTTQFDIEAWLEKFGRVDRVKLRREGSHNKGPFKGSVFVEFHTEEIAKEFVARDPAPTWNGQEMKIMLKADYVAEKSRAIEAGEIEPSKHAQKSFYEGREKGGRGRGRGRGGRGSHNGKDDSNDWKKRRENDQNNGFRGGRGRGRGGRGRGGRGGRGGRDDRNGRDNRDNKRDEAAPKSTTNNVRPPMIQTTNEKGAVVDKTAETNGKRSREDDGGEGPPAKKVDTKAAVAAA
ncbi:La protein [Podospora conica]|nr:La protein [Schizothecium conicum]